MGVSEDIVGTLRAEAHGNNPIIAYALENHPNDSRVKLTEDGIVQTLSGRMGTGGGNTPMILERHDAMRGQGGRTVSGSWTSASFRATKGGGGRC